ncbi:hypothetical protein SAMN04489798_4386 [Pseudomonas arsenicoxydans]|uniref:Uncharacterized protein n=1 Tax=Pseudomonas arsenicoxydans TaxID=702115 RepID=A0A1H0P1I4_9PSED|nr:hypothetical protein SAMN04489798_4386 [Pseudomonas arsenicoxydans]
MKLDTHLPLLVQTVDAAPLPMLVPFIYVQLKLRHCAYNTAAAHLLAIQAFYTCAKSRELDQVISPLGEKLSAYSLGLTPRRRTNAFLSTSTL